MSELLRGCAFSSVHIVGSSASKLPSINTYLGYFHTCCFKVMLAMCLSHIHDICMTPIRVTLPWINHCFSPQGFQVPWKIPRFSIPWKSWFGWRFHPIPKIFVWLDHPPHYVGKNMFQTTHQCLVDVPISWVIIHLENTPNFSWFARGSSVDFDTWNGRDFTVRAPSGNQTWQWKMNHLSIIFL